MATVRWLRAQLADVLASTKGPDGAPRHPEAVEELNRALTEPGDDPPAAMLHLRAARILAAAGDPVGALERVLSSAALDPSGEATAAAFDLLDRPDAHSLVAAARPEPLEEVMKLAAGDAPSADILVLAAGLARHSAKPAQALELLQRLDPGDRTLVARRLLAETLVDLGRSDEAAFVVGHDDVALSDPRLRSVAATIHLLQGDSQRALELAEGVPALTKVRALALLGLGRLPEAREAAATSEDPEVLLARSVLQLAGRDYEAADAAARRASTATRGGTDALLLSAQAAIEGIGAEQEAQAGEGTRPSDALVSGRRLLRIVASQLHAAGRHSPWLRIQDVVRADDGRYGFFRCELEHALDRPVSRERLEGVNRGTTTILQDAALDRRLAENLGAEGDAEGAAAALDKAASSFRFVSDPTAAYECTEEAFGLAPSAERAASWGYAALDVSYLPEADSSDLVPRLDRIAEAVERLLGEVEPAELGTMAAPLAWLKGRRLELTRREAVRFVPEALFWGLVAYSATSPDAGLLALVSYELKYLGMPAAAMAVGKEAAGAVGSLDQPNALYVLSTAGSAEVDYGDHRQAVEERLAQVRALDDPLAQTWAASVELAVCLREGDRAGAARCRTRPMFEAPWARWLEALASALLDGLHVAAGPLGKVVEAALAGGEADEVYGVLPACLLDRVDLARQCLAAARDRGSTTDPPLARAELQIAFATEPAMTPDELLQASLPWCTTPGEIDSLVNVDIPLLVAARSGIGEPVPAVELDRSPVAARLDQLGRLRERWLDELRADIVLHQLARLCSARMDPSLAVVRDAGDRLASVVLPEPRRRMVDAAVSAVLRWQLDEVVPSLLRRVVGRPGRVDDDAVALVMDEGDPQSPSRRLTVALLRGDRPAVESLAGVVPVEGDDVAPEELLATAKAEVHSSEEWWRLDDHLAATGGGPATDLVEACRTALVPVLTDVLELNTPPTQERQSHFSFVLGESFIPEDTGPGWELFSNLIPDMRARVQQETGFEIPACRVRADWDNPDTLWLLVYENPLELHRLPVHGRIRPSADGLASGLADPLTGEPVVVEVEGSAADGTGSLTPLQFLIRHVERFLRSHLALLVSIQDVVDDVNKAAPDPRRVLGDETLLVRWLRGLRALAANGDLHHREAVAAQVLSPAGDLRSSPAPADTQ